MNSKIIKIGILVLGIVIIGCFVLIMIFGEGGIKIGYVGNKSSSELNATFSYFDGKENITRKFEKKSLIVVHYNVVSEEGDLEVQVTDEDNNILATSQKEKGSITLEITNTEKYKIGIEAHKAKGSYEIKVEEKNVN